MMKQIQPFALAAFVLLAGMPFAFAGQERPNVLFIAIDDLNTSPEGMVEDDLADVPEAGRKMRKQGWHQWLVDKHRQEPKSSRCPHAPGLRCHHDGFDDPAQMRQIFPWFSWSPERARSGGAFHLPKFVQSMDRKNDHKVTRNLQKMALRQIGMTRFGVRHLSESIGNRQSSINPIRFSERAGHEPKPLVSRVQDGFDGGFSSCASDGAPEI